MYKLPNRSSKAWVSLLWSQYNKLSEPLKEGFICLAQSMEKEVEGQNIDMEKDPRKGKINGQRGVKNG